MAGEVEFHYKKSKLFRVVHSDGAWGGLTPELDVFFAFFNSRPPIPKKLVHQVGIDGSIGQEVPSGRVSKEGIVREVEVGVVMTPENVKNLIAFLQERLTVIESVKARIGKTEESSERSK